MKKKLVISSGAGISAESGIPVFRGPDGLWEGHSVEDIAMDGCIERNPKLVHDFYNMLRAKLVKAQPNAAHLGLVDLEKDFDVRVITQNVDDLHERAGSSNVLHLHGELMNVRSMRREDRVYTLPCDQLSDKGLETSPDTLDPYGDPVRPHIVFFGEAVPNMEPAAQLAQEADVFVVIGTTLVVYPAAALMQYVRSGVPIYYIDPKPAAVPDWVHVIAKPATQGVADLIEILRKG